MKHILPTLGLSLALCPLAFAQNSPNTAPLRLTLQDALERAQKFSQQTLTANISALLAREDRVQAKAGLLPSVNGLSQFIYTQPNGTLSGIYVSNDGPHVYNDQGVVHADLYAPSKLADYHRTIAAEAVARARAEIAVRDIRAVVTQDYYAMAVASRKVANAQQAVSDAQHFYDITNKQEQGGEVAHADTVKAQVAFIQAQVAEHEAELTLDKARIGFAVLLFPDYRQDYTVADDLDTLMPLPSSTEIQTLAGKNNPDIRAAQATVQQQQYELVSARAARLPSVSADYFFGINANEFATENRFGQNLVGSVFQIQLNVPVWTWGAAASRVRQADLRLQQAKNDLSFAQRSLLAELDAFYREADLSRFQLAALRESLKLSRESLDMTMARYQAGEATAQEVVDAQNTLRDARNALDDGLARYRTAIGNLQTLTGAF